MRRDFSSKKRGGVMELASMAFPLVVSQACETLMLFTDRVFLSKLGPQYMSAAMGGGVTCFMFMTFFFGLTGFSTALVAQYLGAGQPKQCGVASGQALLVSLASYPLVLACIPLGYGLFRVFGLPPEEIVPQRTYFTFMMMGSIIGLLRGTLGAFFSGIGRTPIVMVAAVICLVVNVGAAYALIFGKLGLPALGITGAAIGTIMAEATGLVVLTVAYFRRSNRDTYQTAIGFRFDRPMMAKLLRLGSPSGLEFFLNLLAFNLILLTFHSSGLAVAAAVTVAFNWDMVSFIPLIGINIGVASLVGRYMGSGDPNTAHRAAMSGFKLVCFHSLTVILLFSLFPGFLVELFLPTANTEAWSLGVFMVRLVSVYVFADALALVFSGALRGAGDTFAAMLISVAAHWFLLLNTVVMLRVLHATPRSTWVVFVILAWIMGGGFYLRYRSGRWRSLHVVETEPSKVLLSESEGPPPFSPV